MRDCTCGLGGVSWLWLVGAGVDDGDDEQRHLTERTATANGDEDDYEELKRGGDAQGGTVARKRKPTAAVPHRRWRSELRAVRRRAKRSREQATRLFDPPSTRADPVKLLERQAKTRVPELVPIRYGRMLVSPFTFYRGAASIMAHDLGRDAAVGRRFSAAGTPTCRTSVFASPERALVFDVNDFDETLPGPSGVGASSAWL